MALLLDTSVWSLAHRRDTPMELLEFEAATSPPGTSTFACADQ